ncbi:outer membrane protein assembly factor BamA [Candidatus Endobugula sertula]|uniref:Outer membrane protein assembly factor BamA n=1 Tax=Candidatus Endobugula sertula TaxID=62101 RepID=A0A1D2QQZ3_9GAMM|nr:outer membrane protein assembly factor BamA [Candidatus Endobugula sertula]
MSFFIRCFLLSLISLSVLAETFRVDDIRIEGLQRVSAKTVFSTLSIKVNTEVSSVQLQDAVRELFKTGFFSDIDIARDGSVLIISVSELPAINKIGVTGNSIIATEPLLEGLKEIGLVEGDIFKRSALEHIKRELNDQYSSVGRYATQIQTRVLELEQNKVNIAIKVIEGKVATIKHVNIVGNQQYSDKAIQSLFEIKKSGKWSWITGSDKYAKQKLLGDLERLKSFYFDRGYLEFETISTQVSLSPNKQEVYITINIFEGERYTVSEVEIAGNPIVSIEEIKTFVTVKQGDVFSQKELITTSANIRNRLGNEGYSFANVRGEPELNKEDKTAKVIVFIEPGNIFYVRRIIFKGNTTTQDNVLRREMRQLEGAPVSKEKLDQSHLRLEQLSLFSDVIMQMHPVPGRSDQIDVVFTVIEQPSGNIEASVGYSPGNGLTLILGLQQNNWLGTGNTFGFKVSNSDVLTSYSLNFTNPYFTPDGVSRGVKLSYEERDLNELNISSFSTDRFGLKVTFGYPISEQSRLSWGIGVEDINVQAGAEAVQEIIGSPRPRSGVDNVYMSNSDFNNITGLVDSNRNGFFDENDRITVAGRASLPTLTSPANDIADSQFTASPTGFLDKYGDDFSTLNLSLGWNKSSLNRGIFPTKGMSQNVNVEVTVPGTDLEFYKLIYRNQFYTSISKNYTLRFKNKIGYADSYGSFDTLPFFENFFSGGSDSVRGFKHSTLGPKGTPAVSYVALPYLTTGGEKRFAYVASDDAGGPLVTFEDTDSQTIGGNILFETGMELIFPTPFTRNVKSLRTIFFVDAGNVFSDDCVSTQSSCSGFDINRLSSSAGIGLQWFSPAGPLSIYFSKAIQKQPFDRTETFQFSLGQRF